MALEPGEFLDDPASLLDSTFVAYQSSDETFSDTSSDASPTFPDCHLHFITHHRHPHVFLPHQKPPPSPQKNSVALQHHTVENDQYLWSVPLHSVHVPVPRSRLTIVLFDYKERFRIVVPVQKLQEDVVVGPYLVRLSTARSGSTLCINDVLLREPLHPPPLTI